MQRVEEGQDEAVEVVPVGGEEGEEGVCELSDGHGGYGGGKYVLSLLGDGHAVVEEAEGWVAEAGDNVGLGVASADMKAVDGAALRSSVGDLGVSETKALEVREVDEDGRNHAEEIVASKIELGQRCESSNRWCHCQPHGANTVASQVLGYLST